MDNLDFAGGLINVRKKKKFDLNQSDTDDVGEINSKEWIEEEEEEKESRRQRKKAICIFTFKTEME